MTSRGKRFMLSMLVVTALSGVATSVAAAEERPHYIKGGTEITGELKANVTPGKFSISIPLAKLVVNCEGVASGAVGPKWKSKLRLEFTTCSVQGASACGVAVPFVVELQDQLVYKKGKKGEEIYDIFFSASSKKFAGVFTIIDFTGTSCALEGENPIKGSVIAIPTPNKPGEEAKTLKLGFNAESAPTGKYTNEENGKEEEAGKLSFASDPTFLSGEATLELETKEAFGAI